MSHEGIRIVNAEQARREDMEHEQLPVGCGDSAEGAGEEDRRHGRRDRLEGRAPERVVLCMAAECVSVRDLPRGAREDREAAGRAEAEGADAADDVRGAGEAAGGDAGGQVRAEVQVERRPRERNLLVGVSAPGVPVRDCAQAKLAA